MDGLLTDWRAGPGGRADVVLNRQGVIAERERRSLVLKHLPYQYHVHLNEPCNQKCIMCVPDGRHGDQMLSFESFVSFFDSIKPMAEELTLIGGEPLMYPWIEEVLELIAAHPIAVTINTNATMLQERLVSRLLRLHALRLKCSIDAVTSSTYLRIRGRNHFNRVTENLSRFAELTRDRPEMQIIPVFVVMRENLHEVVPFVEFARTLHPERIEFHPVRHVASWVVSNGTGWTFDGREQVCESFSQEYNEVMQAAFRRCEDEGIACEIHPL